MDWLRKLYGAREREAMFISLPAYTTVVSLLGVALGFQWYVLLGREKSLLDVTLVTLVTIYIWAAGGLVIWELIQVFPLSGRTFARYLPAYLLGGCLLLFLQQLRFYYLGGFGSPRRDLTYLANASFFFRKEAIFYLALYGAVVMLFRGMLAQRSVQKIELRAARIEEQMTRMELLNLRSRLQPHLFFNALNTISAFVREDPALADETIELLSTLMRRNIEAAQKESTSLADELKACEEFLRFQTLRFRSRMEYRIETVPGAKAIMVPTQILQPIMENCVTHGVERSTEVTHILIRCLRQQNQLLIEVMNTQKRPPCSPGFGTGLGSVERRLNLLYGPAGRLTTVSVEGQFRVELAFPISPNGQLNVAKAR